MLANVSQWFAALGAERTRESFSTEFGRDTHLTCPGIYWGAQSWGLQPRTDYGFRTLARVTDGEAVGSDGLRLSALVSDSPGVGATGTLQPLGLQAPTDKGFRTS